MKSVHIITGLGAGGAESMLLKLVRVQCRRGDLARVISLTDIGVIGAQIRALGVPVTALGMRRGHPSALALMRLLRRLSEDRPHVVQTWMYHADLLGGIAARLLGLPVVWGIRHDRLGPRDRALTRLVRQTCALLSPWVPTRIVCNSESARRTHAAVGYAAEKLVVVPNGFELTRFHPDPEARIAVRRELGIDSDAPLVGLVARYHPDKDHETFLAAAARILARFGSVRFLLCGDDVNWSNGTLATSIDRLHLRPSVHLLDRRNDVEKVLASLDVACLSSVTESFPNVLCEAMACGVPCVATDCGDVSDIIGGTGTIVPPRDSEALARGVLDLIHLDPRAREMRGAAARLRVLVAFDIEVVARRFAEIQREVAHTCVA